MKGDEREWRGIRENGGDERGWKRMKKDERK